MSRDSSRSRSRSYRKSRDRKTSRRSRSRSYGKERGGYKNRSRSRSKSHSPLSSRKRHIGERDAPFPSKCLGIFGLSTRTSETDLKDVFDRYPGFRDVKLIYDYGSGISRGFGFLTFESVDDARYVKDKCVGMDIDGRSIRIDFSTTSRAHTPTPGKYLGRPSHKPYNERSRERDYGGSRSGRYGGGGGGGSSRGGGGRYRSRSRSYSRSPRRR